MNSFLFFAVQRMVWKFQYFTATKFLREIKLFGNFRGSKTGFTAEWNSEIRAA